MHYSYEKGGLVIDNQPIPWNADAVIVECLVAHLPGIAARRREEFLLRIPGREAVPLDSLRREEAQECYRLCFRFPPPSQTSNAEVVWRHHRLSEMTLPVVQRAEFLEKLRLQHATLAVQLGELDGRLSDLRVLAEPRPGRRRGPEQSAQPGAAGGPGLPPRLAAGRSCSRQAISRAVVQLSAEGEAGARHRLPRQLAKKSRHLRGNVDG